MPERSNPHDVFFKEVFTQLADTADLVAQYLPPEIVAQLDLKTLALVKDSFVDAELQEHFSDLLFQIQLKDGGGAYLYLLCEHKSWSEHWAAFQVLRYAVRLWEPLVEGKVKKLPPVFPLILHHGPRRWRAPLRFSELIDWRQAEDLRPFVPEFRCFLIDLNALDDAEITGGTRLRVALLLMKHAFNRELGARLKDIFGLLKAWPTRPAALYLHTIMYYLRSVAQQIAPTQFQVGIAAAFRNQMEGKKIMENFADAWIRQGEEQGLQKGLQKGRQEGAASFALNLLQHRLGQLDARTKARLQSLSAAQLEALSAAFAELQTKADLQAWLQKHARKTPSATRAKKIH